MRAMLAWTGGLLAVAMAGGLGMTGAVAQGGPPGMAAEAPPAATGQDWGARHHQPNPAEIEARARARGSSAGGAPGQAGDGREGAEVDRLYRQLTGQDAATPRRADPRATDRR